MLFSAFVAFVAVVAGPSGNVGLRGRVFVAGIPDLYPNCVHSSLTLGFRFID